LSYLQRKTSAWRGGQESCQLYQSIYGNASHQAGLEGVSESGFQGHMGIGSAVSHFKLHLVIPVHCHRLGATRSAAGSACFAAVAASSAAAAAACSTAASCSTAAFASSACSAACSAAAAADPTYCRHLCRSLLCDRLHCLCSGCWLPCCFCWGPICCCWQDILALRCYAMLSHGSC